MKPFMAFLALIGPLMRDTKCGGIEKDPTESLRNADYCFCACTLQPLCFEVILRSLSLDHINAGSVFQCKLPVFAVCGLCQPPNVSHPCILFHCLEAQYIILSITSQENWCEYLVYCLILLWRLILLLISASHTFPQFSSSLLGFNDFCCALLPQLFCSTFTNVLCALASSCIAITATRTI